MKTQNILIGGLFLYILIAYSTLLANDKYTSMQVNYVLQDVSCYNKNDGRIDIRIQGGEAPYIIIWDNGLSTLSLENLRAGEYSVKICDARGKMVTQYFCIDEPKPLELKIEKELSHHLDFLNAQSNISVKGGTPWSIEEDEIYFYRLNNQANFNDSLPIQSGIYQISIEDSRACQLSKEVFLDNLNMESIHEKPNKNLPLIQIKQKQYTRPNTLSTIN